MLAARCSITRREETMHAYDDARHEPPYPPPGDDRVYLGNPLEPVEDAAATTRRDRKLESRPLRLRGHTMTDERDTIWKTADRLQMNLRTCQAQLVELRPYLAALNIPAGWQPPRAGSPRELHPDACPHCEITKPGHHTVDCPTVNDVGDELTRSADESVARYYHARAELERP